MRRRPLCRQRRSCYGSQTSRRGLKARVYFPASDAVSPGPQDPRASWSLLAVGLLFGSRNSPLPSGSSGETTGKSCFFWKPRTSVYLVLVVHEHAGQLDLHYDWPPLSSGLRDHKSLSTVRDAGSFPIGVLPVLCELHAACCPHLRPRLNGHLGTWISVATISCPQCLVLVLWSAKQPVDVEPVGVSCYLRHDSGNQPYRGLGQRAAGPEDPLED